MAIIDNVIGYFPCYDDEVNTVVEDVHSTNDGTLTGGNTEDKTADGIIDKSLDLDGTGDYISVPNQESANSMFFNCWIYPDALTPADYVMATQSGAAAGGRIMRITTGNLPQFTIVNDAAAIISAVGTTAVTTGSFQMMTAVLNTSDNTMKIYLDGVLEASTAATGTYNTTINNFKAGSHPSVIGQFFSGRICEMMTGSGILTDGGVSVGQTAGGEIAELFNSGSGLAYPFAATPTTQATNVSFSTVNPDGGDISWTNGDGEKRAVFIKEDTTGEPAPVDGTTYAANTVFESGDEIGSSGWFCVYNDTGNSVSVTNLDSATTYRVMVIEYNEDPDEVYLTDTATGNPINQATEGAPTTQATNVLSSDVTVDSMTLNWTRGDGDKITLFMKEGVTTGEPAPVEDAVYSADANFGDGDEIGSSGWFCVYDGVDTTLDVTGLTAGEDYRIMGVEYNE